MTKLINLATNKNYKKFISDLKSSISSARLKAHFAVNKELILLYWNIGKQILERQGKVGREQK